MLLLISNFLKTPTVAFAISFTVSEGIHYRKDVKLNILHLTDLQSIVKQKLISSIFVFFLL